MAIKNSPQISIVIPSYNKAKYLQEAINSVLNQTYDNWELIIADDVSNYETINLLKSYEEYSKVKVFYNQKNLGLFKNLNYAIGKTHGKYIFILCNDDILEPNCLSRYVELINEYETAKIIISNSWIIQLDGSKVPANLTFFNTVKEQHQLLKSHEAISYLVTHGSISSSLTGFFFSRQIYDRISGFREDWKCASDLDFLYRVAELGSVLVTKERLKVIRDHENQLTKVANFTAVLEYLNFIKIRLLQNQYIISKPHQFFLPIISRINMTSRFILKSLLITRNFKQAFLAIKAMLLTLLLCVNNFFNGYFKKV